MKRLPIPVERAMRKIAGNLDLARRQQRITMDMLAKRADTSLPTLRKLLNEGKGSVDTLLRVARILGLMDAVVAASDPLNTPIGRLRADEDTPRRVR